MYRPSHFQRTKADRYALNLGVAFNDLLDGHRGDQLAINGNTILAYAVFWCSLLLNNLRLSAFCRRFDQFAYVLAWKDFCYFTHLPFNDEHHVQL